MWFNKNIEDIIEEFGSNTTNGLSSSEAKSRLEKNGPNKLASKKKKSMLQLFFVQINDVMIYILLAAAVISAFMGEVSDAIIILIVILVNAIIGVVQESKAEKALEALKNMSTPKALVKRDGQIIEVPSEEVVVGDIVIIDAGRYIPADLRLIESANLKIEESAFTGESLPSEKSTEILNSENDIPVGDQHNMAFMSTLATYGRGNGIVVATGMDTQIGKIAKMLDAEEDDTTPLQKKLAELGKILGFTAVAISLVMFVVSMIQGRDFMEMFMTSISLAVAAIPEGLPAIVAIVLALGVQRMIKENAIIRKLPAVETLGSVNIICSDKTGTLTINKMTVKKYFVNGELKNLDEIDTKENTSKLLVEGMILCNDATSKDGSQTGDPTEIALLDVGNKFNIFKEDLNSIHKRVDEIPFDSDRKLMTTVNKYDNKDSVFTKGAIDSILKISSKILINGKIEDFSDELKAKVLKASNDMSDEALRVLALGYKIIENEHVEIDSLEKDLIFVGLMGMIDPPRVEVKDSITKSKNAGIRTIMITGDHKNTAVAIAKELGIAENISQAMSGSEIDTYTEEEFTKIVNNFRVFARVSPEHKVKIVKAFKSHGNIVSMTGDGVNDAPSLKAADIGVAMGITGTDVAKGAADMVLTDDNFTTIVKAVEEGRNIFNNIKKSILFLLSCNLGEVVALFFAILFNWDTPLLPIHILWVNLITDSFPALSLGVDPGDSGVMDKKPRNPKESLFAGRMGKLLIINGILIGVTTLFAFKLGEKLYPDSLRHAQTMAFVVLSVSQLFFSLAMRNETKSLFQVGIFKNKSLIGSLAFGIALQFLVISIPFIASIFKVYALTLKDWTIVIGISLIPFIINEIIKVFFRSSDKNKA
ncbi:calcium-translocating P-type ATPase, PMCA-type [Clostridium chauvoei]|uniref:P-type Ca(2+) transporter n=2 Tax=Clostridium chauvoei TaxID=46867 RepID=S6EJI3_9CLOT|nr:calcium-translocating P-type ATPase, PMCA-type [Clostridium chauvoei]ATD54762.1 calcium-translocating P-type ATPase, PMCA-type [Clostridium chauvoei]ATD57558.1 calcium-translocating P-type ATPase, PMCA-type [Clostridium chauvoei]MBX7281258.1 calcium-translocating P-type ATPase, PMCA-type [Clostridium chauvoei]MBX7283740.1 calcium-translocating P-type ATPase, PMCA-type [Clostridium chauvoei]MBX7286360.1 calcium-translocating P-type ATPase, PMCA-type [Clostridium chauvoei]